MAKLLGYSHNPQSSCAPSVHILIEKRNENHALYISECSVIVPRRGKRARQEISTRGMQGIKYILHCLSGMLIVVNIHWSLTKLHESSISKNPAMVFQTLKRMEECKAVKL